MKNLNADLKREADEILYNYGLYNTLLNYTKAENIYISGSYTLDLMVWRDLDLFIDIEGISQDDIYGMVNKVMYQFRPVWIESKDTFNEDSGCPKGYFLGFETLKVNNELWNIDIWVTDKAHIDSQVDYINKIKGNLDDNSRNLIMNLKKQLIESGDYGTKIFSVDVYDDVLNKGDKSCGT